MFYGQSIGEMALFISIVCIIIAVVVMDIITKYKSKY